MKKVLFVIYQAPAGSIWPNEGFRTAFGMYADDVEPEVLLIDQAAITQLAVVVPTPCPERPILTQAYRVGPTCGDAPPVGVRAYPLRRFVHDRIP